MSKLTVETGATGVIALVSVRNSTSTNGAKLLGLLYNTAGLTAYYTRPGAIATVIPLATQTVTGTYTLGGFVEIDPTNQPGLYRIDLPNACFTTGARSVVVTLKGAANMEQVDLEIEIQSKVLTGIDGGVIISSDAHVSGATIAAVTGAVGSVTGAVGSVTAGVTVTTNNDKTDYTLSALDTEITSIISSLASLTSSVAALPSTAVIKTQLSDLLLVDANNEPISIPAANAPLGVKLAFVAQLLRNRKTQNRTTGVETLYADNGTTVVGTTTITDDGTTTSKPEWV